MQWEDTTKKIKIVKTKEQIKEQYPEVFEEIGRFPGEPYHYHTELPITPKQTPCRPIPVHLKETFRQEINKMLAVGVMKPVHEATPWNNSFMVVETKDKIIGKLKLHICLDPTNPNKAIICEPYCFCIPEDIAHKNYQVQLSSHYSIVQKDTGTNHQMRNPGFWPPSTLKLVDSDLLWCHLEQPLQVMFFKENWIKYSSI